MYVLVDEVIEEPFVREKISYMSSTLAGSTWSTNERVCLEVRLEKYNGISGDIL